MRVHDRAFYPIRRLVAPVLKTRRTQTAPTVLRLHDADVGKIAVALTVIEAVSHHKLIRNFEADIFEFDLDNATRSPVQKRTDFQRLWVAARQGAQQILQRKAGIHDVLDKQDVFACNVFFEVFRNSHDALAAFSVARYREEIQRQRQIDLARQIRGEEN